MLPIISTAEESLRLSVCWVFKGDKRAGIPGKGDARPFFKFWKKPEAALKTPLFFAAGTGHTKKAAGAAAPSKRTGGENTKKLFAVCITAVFAGCLGSLWAYAAGEVEYLTIEREVQGEGISFVYSYPKIVKAKTPQAQSILNTSFREYGEYEALEALHRSKASKSPLTGSLDFKVEYNTESLFSIVFTSREEGEAPRLQVFNLDGRTGRTVRICDLFDGEDAEKKAGTLFYDGALKQGWPETQARDLLNFRHSQPYYLTKSQLVLVFDRGQVFPGEAGTLELAFDKAQLRGLIKGEYQG